jgi:hypothetical protein
VCRNVDGVVCQRSPNFFVQGIKSCEKEPDPE